VAARVDRACDQLLAHTAFARNENRIRLTQADFFDLFEDVEHLTALTDELPDETAPGTPRLEVGDLTFEPLVFQSVRDGDPEFLQGVWFEEEVVCTALHRFHGRFHLAIGRHHYNGKRGVIDLERFQDLQPVSVGQFHIEQYEVGRSFLEQLQALGGALRIHYLVLIAERFAERPADRLFVVNYQNGLRHRKTPLDVFARLAFQFRESALRKTY